jgi:hypothetical protein
MNKDYPCRCSHKKLKHYLYRYGCANNWSKKDLPMCMCEKFTADNLKYLESKI